MRRDIFTADHEAFRESVREFVAKEVVPHYADWERAGQLPREVFAQLGSLGVLGMAIPEEYGGAGLADYRYNVVLQEEAARASKARLEASGKFRRPIVTEIAPAAPFYRAEEYHQQYLEKRGLASCHVKLA